jgi:dihydrofolate synthase/folylpolyglutamate synthase
MNYAEAESYILGFTDYEKTPGIAYTAANYDLRRMDKLLAPLDNPHLGVKTVHIAGTKGKGSTAVMTAQVLTTADYKVGMFTSPHLHTLRERIKVNDIMISETEFASITKQIKPIVEKVNEEATYGNLTTFEILTAVVFTYFRRCSVDFQVLEAGLGGRLDATNIAHGDVCVISSISLDHTQVLGNTLVKIAKEKAGIIKPGCIVVNFPQEEEAAEVIRRVCRQQRSKLIQVGEDVTWRRTGGDLNHQSFSLKGQRDEYDLTIPLIGDYQLENAAAAIATVEALFDLGARVPKKAIIKGLRQVNWPGRLQVLKYEPIVVIDGAHNDYSMRKLVEAIKKYFNYNNCFVIFGTSCDKDIAGMARELVHLSNDIVVTSSSHPRAASISATIECFSEQGIEVSTAENVSQALSKALSTAQKNDLILVTGSIFMVAEAITNIKYTNNI